MGVHVRQVSLYLQMETWHLLNIKVLGVIGSFLKYHIFFLKELMPRKEKRIQWNLDLTNLYLTKSSI